jgi:hypothetical protein
VCLLFSGMMHTCVATGQAGGRYRTCNFRWHLNWLCFRSAVSFKEHCDVAAGSFACAQRPRRRGLACEPRGKSVHHASGSTDSSASATVFALLHTATLACWCWFVCAAGRTVPMMLPASLVGLCVALGSEDCELAASPCADFV